VSRLLLSSLLLLIAGPARGAELELASTGREVSVELAVKGGDRPLRCRTPCTLEVPPGVYHARVEGLSRTLAVGEGRTRYQIEPTRRASWITGLVLATLGCSGLAVAQAPDLDGKTRAITVLGGLALMGLGTPLIISSSTRVRRGEAAAKTRRWRGPGHGRRLELEVGTLALLGSTVAPVANENRWRLALGASYYPREWLGVGPRWRLGAPGGIGEGHQVLAAARAQVRLPLVYLYGGLGLGWASERSALLESEVGLRLAASRWLGVSVGAVYQVGAGQQWTHDLLLSAAAQLTF
jgi:hypothetical protein